MVQRQWQTIPIDLPLARRMQALEQGLRPSNAVYFVRLGDTDDDEQPDLLAVSTPMPNRPYNRGPLLIFRAADLAANWIQPHVLPSIYAAQHRRAGGQGHPFHRREDGQRDRHRVLFVLQLRVVAEALDVDLLPQPDGHGALDVDLLNTRLADRRIVAGRAIGVHFLGDLLAAPLADVTDEAMLLGIEPGMIARDALKMFSEALRRPNSTV